VNWKLGQYVRIWKNEGYEYGHIESIVRHSPSVASRLFNMDEVMLVGDDGKEIYCQVKDLESK